MEAIDIKDFNNHKIKEIDVIKRILKGEKELYEILLRRNNQKLFRVIRSYLKDMTEIEDVMQDTYLKAYEKLHQFKYSSKFSTWLLRIGINEALARLNQKNKVYQINASSQYIERDMLMEMPDNNQLNPENSIMKSEAKQLLENAIDQLDAKYRTVYVLKEVEELSTQEVMGCLGISASNVKVRLHRAKNMLKEKLLELTQNVDIFEYGFQRCDDITARVMSLIR